MVYRSKKSRFMDLRKPGNELEADVLERAKRRVEAARAKGERPTTRSVQLHSLLDRFEPEAAESDQRAALEAGEFLQSIREHAHLSPAELADKLGVARPRIHEVERASGSHGPTWSLIKRWARACGGEAVLSFQVRGPGGRPILGGDEADED